MSIEKEDVISYRMYIEGVYDTLRVQQSEDLTGEIGDLLDGILWDLYREAYVRGAQDERAKPGGEDSAPAVQAPSTA